MKFNPLLLSANIKFWIILFFLLRLPHIAQPPLESSHNWRQSLTVMIARNYTLEDSNIFYPKVDFNGRNSTIASELPIFSYSIAAISKVFGYQHWYGRLINLIVSCLGLYCFYKIILLFFNNRMALYSTILLMFSVWLMFSRKIMPDTFSASITIISTYFGTNYLIRGKTHNYILFLTLGILGVLSKIPSLIILSVLIPFVLSNYYNKRNRLMIIAGGVVICILTYFWYYIHVPQIIANGGVQLFFPRNLNDGFNEIWSNLSLTIKRFTFHAFQGYIGFLLFTGGVALAFIKKQKKLILSFIISTVFLILYILKTGDVFSTHSYYIIPYVPIMALFAGYTISEIKIQWLAIALLFIASLESFANQLHDVNIKENDRIKLEYESIADKYIPKNSLVLTNSGMNPQQIYFLNRKGWSIENHELSNDSIINSFYNKGAEFIFLNSCKKNYNALKDKKLIYSQKCIELYKFEK